MLDLKIRQGQILDGSGAPGFVADIGVKGDRIAEIGDLSEAQAARTLEASGRIVCPGFIDAHSHSDVFLMVEPSAPSKLTQGITTEVTGNCGCSAAPIRNAGFLPADWAAAPLPGSWSSFADYAALLEKSRPAPNVLPLVGHGKLRAYAMGFEARAATESEMGDMLKLLGDSMAAGAPGLSTGLIYSPGIFAGAGEIQALARTVAAGGGIYASHMRSEAGALLEAIAETLDVARETGVRVQISHLKTSGRDNWHLADRALDMIRAGRAAGIEAAADRYPYTASCTGLDAILPKWFFAGGKEASLARLRPGPDRERLLSDLRRSRAEDYWSTVIVASTAHPDQLRFQGMPLVEAAEAMRLHPAEAALRIIERDELKTEAFFTGMCEENMWKILAEPYVMIGSDASLRATEGPMSRDFPHPRAYGTFPKFLRAAIDGITAPLPEAIRKMTSLPANHFRIRDRGLIAKGMFADLVMFDPGRVRDRATFSKPHQYSEGIEAVLVNGRVTLDGNGFTGERAGRVLLR